ncbi:hypothetical protein SDC9_170866 [bioreactor metagenome]|uniref:Uncharacterized protein n=1 Tax=bioreactor metagenome TaxID=1076179 RepID=A0A645G9A4_9ZZZZ
MGDFAALYLYDGLCNVADSVPVWLSVYAILRVSAAVDKAHFSGFVFAQVECSRYRGSRVYYDVRRSYAGGMDGG